MWDTIINLKKATVPTREAQTATSIQLKKCGKVVFRIVNIRTQYVLQRVLQLDDNNENANENSTNILQIFKLIQLSHTAHVNNNQTIPKDCVFFSGVYFALFIHFGNLFRIQNNTQTAEC